MGGVSLSSEWDGALEDTDSSYRANRTADTTFSPPTSPSAFASKDSTETGVPRLAEHSEQRIVEDTRIMEVHKVVSQPVSTATATPKSSNLLSFFKPISPKKRARADNAEMDGERLDAGQKNERSHKLGKRGSTASAFASTSTLKPVSTLLRSCSALSTSSCPSAVTKPKAKPKLEQLYLDPYTTAGHSTLSCAICSLSYARTPDDIALHDRHHKRVVRGCDWISATEERENNVKGSLVVKDGIEWGNGEVGGKIIMTDAHIDGAVGKKVSSQIDSGLFFPLPLFGSRLIHRPLPA